MPRKGENIYKRKDGRWEGRYIKSRSPEGKARYGYLYASSYQELKEKMERTARRQECGTAVKLSPSSSLTFESAAWDWFHSATAHIKISSSIKYSNLLKSYIIPYIGNLDISEISFGVLETYCSNLLIKGGSKGTGLSPKTVSDCFTLVRKILQQASDRGFRPPCDGKSIAIKQHSKELRILSRNEQQTLRAYLYENLNERNMGILVCMFTGIRIGELCALKWKDISFSERTVHIQRTMQRLQTNEGSVRKTRVVVTEPKSRKSARMIPLPDELTEILEKYKMDGEVYLLTGMESRYVEPRTMQNHFHRVLCQCSIEDANFHALRHTFATRCVELGFDIKTLSEILGHASVNITMNRYVHPSMELKRENMQRLSALFTVQ